MAAGGAAEVVKSLSSHPSVDLPVKLAKKQLWALQCVVPRASTGHIQTHSGTLLGREPVDALVTHEPRGLFFLPLPSIISHTNRLRGIKAHG